ncbi:MAG: ABC transporter substrate-binding protein [Pseudomonadota bacterium]
MVRKSRVLGLVAGAVVSALAMASAGAEPAQRAQAMPKIVLGMSGWTGFAPLSLAEKDGLFKKHGVDVEIKFVPQMQRHLAMAAGDLQAIATTVDTHIAYTAAGVKLTQVLLLDKSDGGDGIAVRSSIKTVADLKGKTVAVDGAGTTPYFTLAYILKRNNLTLKDVNIVKFSPKDAATSFVAGQHDAVVTYEPYLSQIRAMPSAGSILVTTKDYPVVVDTLAFQPEFIAKNPRLVRAVVEGFFDALEMIKANPARSHEIMGAVVKQAGTEFAKSASFIAWQDRKANNEYFAKEMLAFLQYAADLQKEAGVIKDIPDLKAMMDDRFLKPQS